MKEGADDFWFTNTKEREQARKSGWKMTLNDDPRVTKIGRIIRQT